MAPAAEFVWTVLSESPCATFPWSPADLNPGCCSWVAGGIKGHSEWFVFVCCHSRLKPWNTMKGGQRRSVYQSFTHLIKYYTNIQHRQQRQQAGQGAGGFRQAVGESAGPRCSHRRWRTAHRTPATQKRERDQGRPPPQKKVPKENLLQPKDFYLQHLETDVPAEGHQARRGEEEEEERRGVLGIGQIPSTKFQVDV